MKKKSNSKESDDEKFRKAFKVMAAFYAYAFGIDLPTPPKNGQRVSFAARKPTHNHGE